MRLAIINLFLNLIFEVISKTILSSIGRYLILLVVLLPLPLVHGLKLRQRKGKAGLLVVFLLGGGAITVSAARFIRQLIVSNNTAICK
jgi:hypothetical protein